MVRKVDDLRGTNHKTCPMYQLGGKCQHHLDTPENYPWCIGTAECEPFAKWFMDIHKNWISNYAEQTEYF
jgi:hypothetical protein